MTSILRRPALLGFMAAVAIIVVSALRLHAAPDSGGSDRHRIINEKSPGQTVDIAKFVVPGKTNIFDFYSKYCPPCMAIGPHLEKLAEARTDIVVNKIDINRPDVQGIDWKSPVARQYNLDSIPHFVIYDADGKKVAEGETAADKVITWIKDNEKGSGDDKE